MSNHNAPEFFNAPPRGERKKLRLIGLTLSAKDGDLMMSLCIFWSTVLAASALYEVNNKHQGKNTKIQFYG